MIRSVAEWTRERGYQVPIDPAQCESYAEALRIETARRVENLRRARRSEKLRAAWRRACRESFRVWRDNFAVVYDESRRLWLPFLARPYQDELQAIYLGLDGWRIPDTGELYTFAGRKSRKVGASVTVAVAVTWLWQWSPTPDLQTIVGLKARALDNGTRSWGSSPFGKLRNLILKQPDWIRPQGWRDSSSLRFVSKAGLLVNPETGAVIQAKTADASSKVADANRGSRSFRIWIDETAMFSDLRKVFEVFQKDGPIYATSTVNPGSYFSQLFRGTEMREAERGDAGGIVLRTIHYSLIPEYDPKTELGRKRIESEKASTPPGVWAREMEMSEAECASSLIWADVFKPEICCISDDEAREVLTRIVSDPRVVTIETLDFGYGQALTEWLASAWVPPTGNAPSLLYLLEYMSWTRATAFEITQAVEARGWRTRNNPSGRPFSRRVCDPSGIRRGSTYAQGVRVEATASWIENLSAAGLDTAPQGIEIYRAVELVRRGLADGRIRLFPACCRRNPSAPEYPSVRESIEQYAWDLTPTAARDHAASDRKPKKTVYANGADCIQFAAWSVWAPASVSSVAIRRDGDAHTPS